MQPDQEGKVMHHHRHGSLTQQHHLDGTQIDRERERGHQPQTAPVPMLGPPWPRLLGAPGSSGAFLKQPQPWARLRMGKVFAQPANFITYNICTMDNLRVGAGDWKLPRINLP